MTKLPFPNGPTEGVPPGYASTSKAESSATIFTQSSPTPIGPFNNTSPVLVGSPYEIISATSFVTFLSANAGSPALSAAIAKNETNVFGSTVVGPVTTTASGAAGLKPEATVATSESQVTFVRPSLSAIGPPTVVQGGSVQASVSFETITTPSAVIAGPSSETEASAVPLITPNTVSTVPLPLANATLAGTRQVGDSNASPTAVTGAKSANVIGLAGTQKSSGVPVAIPAAAQTTTTINTNASITLPAEGSLVPMASQTLVEIGAVGSPISSSGENQGAPITLAAQPPKDQASASAQPSATILSSVVGAIGVTSFAQVSAPTQPATTIFTPVVGASGVSSSIPAFAQPAASILSPVVAVNGVTNLAQVPAPAQSAATIMSPVIGANGVASFAKSPAPAQSAVGILTPVVGSNGVTALVPAPAQPEATEFTPVVGANGVTSIAAVSSPVEQTSAPALAAATVLTPVVGANGVTSLAVIPTPVVGANGLTSLAIFSTPVAAANGVAPPAVILTPVVGANGLTSLAVLATPVIGANGLTSLAIGMASEQNAAQPNGTPSPVEGYVLIAESAGQGGISTPPVFVPSGASGITLPSGPPPESGGGSNANSSVHTLLSPSFTAEYEGSTVKLSLGFGAGLIGMLAFLILL